MRHTGQQTPETSDVLLLATQDQAFDRIEADAKAYVDQESAMSIYVQESLFDVTVAQEHETLEIHWRDDQIKANPGSVILFPDELTELRLRAAYHGAGIATEPSERIPNSIAYRLFDNLTNYPPDIPYEKLYLPYTYIFEVSALKSVLMHDFRIAAEDAADGDLHRLDDEN